MAVKQCDQFPQITQENWARYHIFTFHALDFPCTQGTGNPEITPNMFYNQFLPLLSRNLLQKKPLWRSKIDLAMPSHFFLFLLLCVFISLSPGTNTKESGKKKFKRKGGYKEMANKK